MVQVRKREDRKRERRRESRSTTGHRLFGWVLKHFIKCNSTYTTLYKYVFKALMSAEVHGKYLLPVQNETIKNERHFSTAAGKKSWGKYCSVTILSLTKVIFPLQIVLCMECIWKECETISMPKRQCTHKPIHATHCIIPDRIQSSCRCERISTGGKERADFSISCDKATKEGLNSCKCRRQKRKTSFLSCRIELFITERSLKGHCDLPAPTFISKVLVCHGYPSVQIYTGVLLSKHK